MRVIKRRKGSRPFPATADERAKDEINEGNKNKNGSPPFLATANDLVIKLSYISPQKKIYP